MAKCWIKLKSFYKTFEYSAIAWKNKPVRLVLMAVCNLNNDNSYPIDWYLLLYVMDINYYDVGNNGAKIEKWASLGNLVFLNVLYIHTLRPAMPIVLDSNRFY